MVDVLTDIVIGRPIDIVSAFAADPERAPEWYVNIKSAQWRSTPPLQQGSRVAFTAQFLGKRLEYTYKVTELVPGERLVMHTAEGPFPMETTYTWARQGETATRMTLRNRGSPRGFSKLVAPLLSSAMRRANKKDLLRLKQLLEER